MIALSKPTKQHITREILFDELENCPSSDCLEIRTIKTFDFQTFDKILREKKRQDFQTETAFQDYKKEILFSTQNGTCDLPLIKVKSNKKWNIIDGRMRLLAYKVLGINPVVEFV